MIVCPRCKDTFDINQDNIEPVLNEAGEAVGWQHIHCPQSNDTDGK